MNKSFFCQHRYGHVWDSLDDGHLSVCSSQAVPSISCSFWICAMGSKSLYSCHFVVKQHRAFLFRHLKQLKTRVLV